MELPLQRKKKKTTRKSNPRHRIITFPISLILIIVSLLCLFLICYFTLRIPDNGSIEPYRLFRRNRNDDDDVVIGKFGEMMLDMIPSDLPFTVFIPTETAFKREMGLEHNDTATSDERDNVYATVSRVVGFSTVPRKVYSEEVRVGKGVVEFESVSGFRVSLYRERDGGGLVVNGVRALRVDVVREEVVVHLIDGVVMDAEFAQSVRPDDDDGNVEE